MINKSTGNFIGIICGILTAIVGHHIHGSIIWAIINLFFWPLAWLKWLLCQEVNMSIIRGAFDFFLQ